MSRQLSNRSNPSSSRSVTSSISNPIFYERFYDSIHLEVVCQPPHFVRVGELFTPPIVVRSCDDLLLEDARDPSKLLQANVVLLEKIGEDRDGNSKWVRHCLGVVFEDLAPSNIIRITSTRSIEQGRSESLDWVYFVFDKLHVNLQGYYEVDIEVVGNNLSDNYGKVSTKPVEVEPRRVPDPEPREISKSFF